MFAAMDAVLADYFAAWNDTDAGSRERRLRRSLSGCAGSPCSTALCPRSSERSAVEDDPGLAAGLPTRADLERSPRFLTPCAARRANCHLDRASGVWEGLGRWTATLSSFFERSPQRSAKARPSRLRVCAPSYSRRWPTSASRHGGNWKLPRLPPTRESRRARFAVPRSAAAHLRR